MSRFALSRSPRVWFFVGIWAVFVSALHFGGLAYDIYTKIWWWDLLTHSLSGFGVAGVLFVVFPRMFDGPRAPVVVAGVILAIGAGFEVYEYLFKDFWYGWSASYYAEDTLTDLVVDVVGALGFLVVVDGVVRLTDTPVEEPTEPHSTPVRTTLRSDGGHRSVLDENSVHSRQAHSPRRGPRSRR
ncbi:hypothetical protein [Haloferax sp. DFSO52]|uniref:hypothetical protein n=1 Tax=Haloferax sp. DFSO52 TaxID=3388505 RepID=UPI003A83B5EB